MLTGCDEAQEGESPSGVHLPPRPAAHLLPRPALVARIDAAVRGALTVLAAPAGWGKTAVLTQWAASTTQLVAWMRCGPETTVAALRSDITSATAAARSGTAVLVIEGADRLDPDVRDELAEIVESAPTMRFVITSRKRGLFPAVSARLRARDDLAVLTADDLAFTRDDVRSILEATGAPAGTDAVDARWGETGGWPAAVAFGDGDGGFADYCRAEILLTLPEPVRGFVLVTAQLDRFTARLARATTGRPDAAAIMQDLERALLIEREPVPHDDDSWFGYRAPLRAVARAELNAVEPERVRRALGAAAIWHVHRGEIADLDQAAVYYARAHRWAGLLMHVTRSTPRLYDEGRVRDGLRWMTAIPKSTRHAHPDGVILEATLYTLVGETRRAGQVLRAIEDLELSTGQIWAIALVRALWVQGHLAPNEAIAAADDAMRLLDDPASAAELTRGTASYERVATVFTVARARALWYLGDTTAALRALEHATTATPTAAVQVCGLRAQIEAHRGSLRHAERHILDAERIALDDLHVDHPLLVTAALAHVHLLIERNETARAEAAWARAAELSRPLDFDAIRTELAIERARLALTAGEPADGLEALDSVSELARPPLLDARCRAIGSRLALSLGDVDAARHRLRWTGTTMFPKVAAVATQLALATDDLAAARRVIGEWPHPRHDGELLLRELWSASVDFAVGDRDVALHRIGEVAARAAAERRVRMFLDGLPELRPLLTLAARAEPGGFLSSILRPEHRVLDEDGLIAAPSLSPRERAVLEALAQRLTYAEIADRLFISQNTVKSHAKSVYTKLGVGGRRDAVGRAEALGLL